MPADHIADITDSSYDIAFIYPEIGADRDICHVYWDNQRWVQVLYDPFREQWSGIFPVLFGGCEAIARHFNLDPALNTWPAVVTSSPNSLQAPGEGKPAPDVIYLKNVRQYVWWRNLQTWTDYLAEQAASGVWHLATLDKQAFEWNIEERNLSDTDLQRHYLAGYPKIALLGGIPPTGGGTL